MIAELGHFSLILGLVFALLLAWLPAQGVKRDQLGLMQMAKPLALGLGKLSVGAQYFNSVMLPLTLVLTLLMGAGLFLQWQQDTPKRLWQFAMPVVVTTLLASVLIPLLLLPEFSGMMVLGLLMVSWVGLVLCGGLSKAYCSLQRLR